MPLALPPAPRCAAAVRLLGAAAFLTALPVCRVDAQVLVASTDPGLRARVDSLFAPWSGTDRPGCAVGASRNGRTLFERAYGMADLENGAPMTPATVVHAASLAKSVTAMAVLLLARDGRLGLDDDVRRYLPELPDYGVPITIRHLLTHTSGLRDFFELLIIARGRFEEERITGADATAMIARQRALNFAPGTQYGYSNTGYLLAARIVERVSGQPFADFVAQRILTPLGMTHTRVKDPATSAVRAAVTDRAVGHARRAEGWRVAVPNFDVVGSTNLETTVGDLLLWTANLAHPTVGDSAIVRQMLTPGVLVSGDTTTYGLGLSLQRDRGLRVVEHEGRDPGFRAYFGWYPDSSVAVALLCNAAALDPVGLGRRVAAATLGLPAEPARVQPPVDDGAARRALEWAGVYLEPSTRQVAELTLRDGVLYTDRVGGARVEAIGDRRARLVGVPLELEFDSTRPRAGYVVRWLVPGRRADRFEWRAPIAPALDPASLATYAGGYASPELASTYRVEAGDSTLTLRTAESPPLVARPVFPDGFVSGQYTIQFVRTRGKVTGFEISHPRARGVKFVRAD